MVCHFHSTAVGVSIGELYPKQPFGAGHAVLLGRRNGHIFYTLELKNNGSFNLERETASFLLHMYVLNTHTHSKHASGLETTCIAVHVWEFNRCNFFHWYMYIIILYNVGLFYGLLATSSLFYTPHLLTPQSVGQCNQDYNLFLNQFVNATGVCIIRNVVIDFVYNVLMLNLNSDQLYKPTNVRSNVIRSTF